MSFTRTGYSDFPLRSFGFILRSIPIARERSRMSQGGNKERGEPSLICFVDTRI